MSSPKVSNPSSDSKASTQDIIDFDAFNALKVWYDMIINKKHIVSPVKNKECNHIYERSIIYQLLSNKNLKEVKCPYMRCYSKITKKNILINQQDVTAYITKMLQKINKSDLSKQIKSNEKFIKIDDDITVNETSIDDSPKTEIKFIDKETGDNDLEKREIDNYIIADDKESLKLTVLNVNKSQWGLNCADIIENKGVIGAVEKNADKVPNNLDIKDLNDQEVTKILEEWNELFNFNHGLKENNVKEGVEVSEGGDNDSINKEGTLIKVDMSIKHPLENGIKHLSNVKENGLRKNLNLNLTSLNFVSKHASVVKNSAKNNIFHNNNRISVITSLPKNTDKKQSNIQTLDKNKEELARSSVSQIDGRDPIKPGRQLSCDFGNCNKTFIKRVNLEMHRKKGHILGRTKFQLDKDNEYVCDFKGCTKRFDKIVNFNSHILVHKAYLQPFLCQWYQCGKRFSGANEMKRHALVHTKPDRFNCDTCEKRFSRGDVLKKHKSVCTTIKKQMGYTKPDPFNCDTCEKKFSRGDMLNKHKRICTTKSKPRSYICVICKEKFMSANKLQIHHINTCKSRDWYRCKKCKLKMSRADIQKHKFEKCVEKIHNRSLAVNFFVCDICQKQWTRKFSLERHRRKHTGEKSYSCSVCEKKFSRGDNLKKHKCSRKFEESSSVVNFFVCDICQKQCTRKDNLEVHRKIHTGEKPYSCRLCEKKFSRGDALKKHKCGRKFEESSSGVDYFVCDICQAVCSSKNVMELHKRHHRHRGEKLHYCSVCGKGFKTSDHLNLHRNVHTGKVLEKPHFCSQCSAQYVHKVDLKHHIDMFHFSRSCNLCGEIFEKEEYLSHRMNTHLKMLH